MSDVVRDANGRIRGGVNNPTGKGGFGDHPENRQPKWSRRSSIRWNLRNYMEMTNQQLAVEVQRIDELTQAEQIALRKVLAAKREDDLGFKVYQDVANRTEGCPRQQIDHNLETVEPPTIELVMK